MQPQVVITMGQDGTISYQSNVPAPVLLGLLEAAKACVLRDYFGSKEGPRLVLPAMGSLSPLE